MAPERSRERGTAVVRRCAAAAFLLINDAGALKIVKFSSAGARLVPSPLSSTSSSSSSSTSSSSPRPPPSPAAPARSTARSTTRSTARSTVRSTGAWKSRPVLPPEFGGPAFTDKEMAELRSLAAKPQIEQSIKYKPLSKAMDEALDDHRFRSQYFQRKAPIRTAADLPYDPDGATELLATAGESAALRAHHAENFGRRQARLLQDHGCAVLGVLAHLAAMHALLGPDVVPQGWLGAYTVGGLAGALHLALLGRGVQALATQSWADVLGGVGGGARWVLLLPLAAASQELGQEVLPFPVLVCGYFTYLVAAAAQALAAYPATLQADAFQNKQA